MSATPKVVPTGLSPEAVEAQRAIDQAWSEYLRQCEKPPAGRSDMYASNLRELARTRYFEALDRALNVI